MGRIGRQTPVTLFCLALSGLGMVAPGLVRAEESPGRIQLGPPLGIPPEPAESLPPPAETPKEKPSPKPFPPPVLTGLDRPYPINLPAALELAQVEPLDIAVATQRWQAAGARLQQANRQWLPTIYLGWDYARHDGQLQDVGGAVFGTSKSSMMLGAGPSLVFSLSDAVLAPLAARQDVRARSAGIQVAQNDSLLAVAEGYFTVQQARGELAGALEALGRGEELVRRAEKLAKGLVPPVEAARARTELARRRQALAAAREKWKTASAELARLLRLEPAVLVDPMEAPQMQITLIDEHYTVDDLIPMALTYRPELAAQQALVQATLERLRQERLRPLLPSVLLRGNATNPAAGLSTGYFGGGKNDDLSQFSARNSFDVQVLWELQNLGLNNLAKMNERRAENRLALLELFRLQDRIAAEVVQAHAQAQAAAARIVEAEAGLKDALFSVDKNFEGLTQTKRVGENVILLVIRPQEAVASLQALVQAYLDFYGAVADFNRAQFRLYRALGNPRHIHADNLPGKSCP